MKKLLVVISGPTAIGKSDLAIDLALHYNTEILSSDSRQFYYEMMIGTARPDDTQLKQVPHHFIGHLSVRDYYNVSRFETDVLTLLAGLFEKKNLAIMVGGSGLYSDAVCNGIDDMPDYDPELRNTLSLRLKQNGIEDLRCELKQLDPEAYEKVDLHNGVRVLRALEVCLLTGKPYSAFLNREPKRRPFSILKIALDMDRVELYNRINHRVDVMMETGLLDEVKSLQALRNYNALKTVGYRELFSYIDGECSLEEAVDLIKRNTRKYARKQLTYLRRDNQYQWFHPATVLDIISLIDKNLVLE